MARAVSRRSVREPWRGAEEAQALVDVESASGVRGRILAGGDTHPGQEASEVIEAAGEQCLCGRPRSIWLRGRRAWPVPESGRVVVAQSFTLGTVMMRRHSPICTTRGTFGSGRHARQRE